VKSDIVDVETQATDRIVRSGKDRERVEVYRPRIDSSGPKKEFDVKKRLPKPPHGGSSGNNRSERDGGKTKVRENDKQEERVVRDHERKPQPIDIDKIHPPVTRRNPEVAPKERPTRGHGEDRGESREKSPSVGKQRVR
jgi:hypothetical protein